MYRALIACLCLAAAGCGRDPLSDRVDGLEKQMAQLKGQQEADRQALLARLDQIAVTPDNVTEVADIRAKLAQTGVTADDFSRLQARVQRLEQQVVDWTAPVNVVRRSVYAVLHGVYPGTDKSKMKVAFVGTAFATGPQTLITNGHMVDALNNLNKKVAQYNTQQKANLQTAWMVVQNQTVNLAYKQNYFFIGGSATHPGWDSTSTASVDVGLLRLQEGTIGRTLTVVSKSTALSLQVGQPIGTLGFPGELQAGNVDDLYPIATFKEGTISALRPPQTGTSYTITDTYILQHNLDLSAGTSGSPIFNPAGKVVAVNNSGIAEVVPNTSGGTVTVEQAALGFGIRADKIQEMLASQAAAKPAGAAPDLWRWLDGRDLSDLHLCSVAELERQLE